MAAAILFNFLQTKTALRSFAFHSIKFTDPVRL